MYVYKYSYKQTRFSGYEQDEAKAAVEELCSFLGEFESSCDALVDQYFEEIWNLLLDETVSELFVNGMAGNIKDCPE